MRWFALTVKPQHERTVARSLEAKSLEAYVPTYTQKKRWSDRTKAVERPLFPRYVFCRFSFKERLKVLSTPSIVSLVSFNGTPTPIPQQEIEAVKVMVHSGLPLAPEARLHVGQKVRIMDGALCGLEGVVVRDKSIVRVVVNVDLLQRAVSVELDRETVHALRQELSTAPVGGSLPHSASGTPEQHLIR